MPNDRSAHSARSPSGSRKILYLLAGLVLLVGLAFVAMLLGAYSLSGSEVLGIILRELKGEAVSVSGELPRTIVWDIRLPRILLAIMVGLSLATAGTVYQACFRNPLVEPYILGVSAGAALGAALGISFPQVFLSVQLLAFLGGAIAVFSAYTLSRHRGETPVVTLVLSGIIIGSIATALVSVLKYLSDDTALREIVFWYMGGFYQASWADLRWSGPIVMVVCLLIWRLSWKLNILSMGDEEARSLGVHPERYKLLLVTMATLITALAVSVSGIIAWVGLMMPHAARMLLGPDHRYVVPLAAIMGALYLIICDTLARTLTTAEIPVGIITSIIGAPYLLFLLRSKGRSLTSS